jgi:hypothetical protein
MRGAIFLVAGQGKLVKMDEQEYSLEEHLQALLADYPDLLAGDQINSAQPRRWLLVAREAGVPADEASSLQWRLDHLFLDQDAVPTLVEVKRSSNTEIRRQVVGQMLDYAANAAEYWPPDALPAKFAETCRARAIDPDATIYGVLGDGGDPGAFWAAARTNLQEGRIRLLFVADTIPNQLRRIIEFLNSQMDRSEVLGVEIKQYVGPNGEQVLVSRVIGQSEQAQQKKTASERKQWDEDSFILMLEESGGVEEGGVARRIFEWARQRNVKIDWTGSPSLKVVSGSHVYTPGFVRPNGVFYVPTASLVKWPPFDTPQAFQELVDRLKALPNVALPPNPASSWVAIPLGALRDDRAFGEFAAALEWFASTVIAAVGEGENP